MRLKPGTLYKTKQRTYFSNGTIEPNEILVFIDCKMVDVDPYNNDFCLTEVSFLHKDKILYSFSRERRDDFVKNIMDISDSFLEEY